MTYPNLNDISKPKQYFVGAIQQAVKPEKYYPRSLHRFLVTISYYRIQNNAARLVLQKSKRQHVTPLLKQLHWLPIQTRIDYKLATLAFRHFDGSLPQYLSSRLDIYEPSRSLRSSNDRLLRVPRWKLKSFGYRSFSYQGPVVWNSLPTDLKLSSSLSSFKSRLKTQLFKKSYSLC